jgi:hypothetical protein
MEGMDDDVDAVDGCAGGEEDDEFQHIKDEADKSELLYQKWLRLQVTHWAVLDTVSVNARLAAAPRSLKVSLIAVEHPDDKLRVEPWKTTVRDVLASRSPQSSTDTDFLNAEAVIDTINRHVKLRTEKNAQWLNPIFRAFENDPVCVTFRLPVHCEAVLASLVTYAPESQTESVKTFIQVNFYLCGLTSINLTLSTEHQARW